MQFGIDNLKNTDKWQELFAALPSHLASPFFSPQYLQAYNVLENADVECFWAVQDEENFLFYPYLKKSVNALGYELSADYCDTSGAYGYNGPQGVARDAAFLNSYNSKLQEHLRESRVVTEFVRYCPITNNRNLHTYTKQADVLDNVFIDLSNGTDWVWNQSFEYRVRKTVRKGDSYSLSTALYSGNEITDEVLQQFYQIYHSTMTRNAADEFYFFDLSFFCSLVRNLGDMALIALSYYQDIPVTAELLLVNGSLAFGFLGGTLSEYYDYKPNTYQRWELVKHLFAKGVRQYSIGGGAVRGDGIYSFKRSFARDCSSVFFIGTKVHLPDVYELIRSQWTTRYPESAARFSNRIQGYRIQA